MAQVSPYSLSSEEIIWYLTGVELIKPEQLYYYKKWTETGLPEENGTSYLFGSDAAQAVHL